MRRRSSISLNMNMRLEPLPPASRTYTRKTVALAL
jgi:hypothetical protein